MSFSNTFQKNKRFWMAAVLMICIISFVFCGMPQVNDQIMSSFGRSGDTIATIGGKRITSKQLGALKASVRRGRRVAPQRSRTTSHSA